MSFFGNSIDDADRSAPHIAAIEERARTALRLVGVAALLLFLTGEADAAALGSVATSIGPLAVFTALVVLKGWHANVNLGALPSAGSAMLGLAAVTWLWRTGVMQRIGKSFVLHRNSQRFATGQRSSNVPHARQRPSAGNAQAAPAFVALPHGIDRDALIEQLSAHFLRLQAAWDMSEVDMLTKLTTPEMLEQMWRERNADEAPAAGLAGCTEIVTLDVELLGFEDMSGMHLVSVCFAGLIRDAGQDGSTPFRELWLLTKSAQEDAGWRLARHQALV